MEFWCHTKEAAEFDFYAILQLCFLFPKVITINKQM